MVVHVHCKIIHAMLKQQVRFNLNVDKKREIARFAVINHITSGDHIFLDAGTTTYEMVSFFCEKLRIYMC